MLSKKYYSHGFLYHPDSRQILLQQKIDEKPPVWTLLEDLKKFHPKTVLPIYDYVVKGKKHVISYAEVKSLGNFPAAKGFSFGWFNMKQILKLGLSSQTKQDIIVGQRVIDSQIRKDTGERTIG